MSVEETLHVLSSVPFKRALESIFSHAGGIISERDHIGRGNTKMKVLLYLAAFKTGRSYNQINDYHVFRQKSRTGVVFP